MLADGEGLRTFPLRAGNEVYTTRLVLDSGGMVGVLKLASNRRGEKIIRTFQYDKEIFQGPLLNVRVLGYLRIPWGERIAIVVGKSFWGHGGPPDDLVLEVVGASLTTGFKTSR